MAKGFSELRKTGKSSAYKRHEKTRSPEQEKLQQALAFMQQGSHENAEAIYRELIEKGIENYIVFGNLAVICYMKHDIEEMITFLRKALEIKPNYPEALNNMGIALKEQGKLQGAIDCYQQALAVKPNYPEALNNLATVLKGQGELQEAIDCYRKILTIRPNSLDVLNNLTSVLKEQGKLQEAIACYRQALAINPNIPEVLNNLGIDLEEQGELQEAVDSYRQALAIKPDYPEALNNLGIALEKQGKLQEAVDSYRQALAIKPDYPGALNNLGVVLKEQGELQEAIACYRQALTINSNSPDALNNLGIVLEEEGKLQEAIACYRQALAIKPNDPGALNNLGSVVKGQGELQEAIACYRKVLAIKPNDLDALNNLGTTLKEQGELQEAIDCHRKALAIKPDYPRALNNLGTTLKEQGELQEAIACYRQALATKPDYPEALTNLGAALMEQWKLQEAIAIYRKVISFKQDFSPAHFNLSLGLLFSGDYENGWEEYEWRLCEKVQGHGRPQLKRWDGYNIPSNNRLVLVGEQGLGDILQFMRYVPSMAKRGMDVVLCTLTKLHDLIRASGIATEIYSPEEVCQLTTGEWLPLLSLPKHLKIRPNHVLVNKPYIKVPEEKILYWKQKLSSEKRPIIAINWQGNMEAEKGMLRGRSLPSLEILAPIAEAIDASFLSLQKGPGAEQLATCKFFDRFVDCQQEINQTWDFVENAAMVMNCDLIITVDTVMAHLAGGLGKPTWVLLHHIPDWRWGMEGDTTFWYPSMRLFRQREQGNWQEVIHPVAMALKTFPSNHPS